MKILMSLTFGIAVFALNVQPQIFGSGEERIEFRKEVLQSGVSWSHRLHLRDSGLESEQVPPNQSIDIWIQTHAFPIGMSWRPPTSTSISVGIDGTLHEPDQQRASRSRAFFRYSPDKLNWSSWYFTTATEKPAEGWRHQGSLVLPEIASERYNSLMREWWSTSPAWSSDEHEFCEWLIRKEPNFFEKELPFIGYIQVRIEQSNITNAGNVKAITIKYSSGVGGLTSPTKDSSKVRKTTGNRWFFTGIEKRSPLKQK
jgi:hypothetical protein